MTSSSKPNLLSFTIFFLFISTRVISHKNESFSIYIIHRDSSKSPLFDNTSTPFQRFHNAMLRSNDRVNELFPNNARTTNDDPHPIVFGHGFGEYIMQYSLGSPQFTTYGVIDTGSSWSWLQCKPSSSSYNQGLLPFLDTNIYQAFVPIDYCTDMCNHIVRPSVSAVIPDQYNCHCMYGQEYLTQARSYGHALYGLLRLQTITGAYVGFPTFVFGCSRAYMGYFSPAASGIVGFGRQPASLISQIYNRIDGKFGYCLVPMGGPDIYSKMKFGQSALVVGPDVVYTPLVVGEPANHYWVSFEGISVGNKRIPYITGEMGNMVIDTATVITRLPQELCEEVEAEVGAELDLLHERTPDPSPPLRRLCYSKNSIQEMGGPTIIIHLSGGDLVLSAENIYIQVDDETVCFNFIPLTQRKAILGAMTQTNFMVTFDLQRTLIS